MVGTNLLDIQNRLRENGLLISFSGRFSQAIIEELGEAVKKYLELEQSPANNIHNIFSIFIEQTQNIKNYCESKDNTEGYHKISNSCIVTIGKVEELNYICSGNLIASEDIPILVEKLDHILRLDKVELKKLYKEVLRREMAPGSKGAGMGLIDMARKATVPLEYSITRLDNDYSFLTIKAVV
ncbi:SiaB family protein kinase [Ammoniphilus sp. CFH 90114]|uniref:SiaB family protein kinase n=1 Tax=Ammoniphilus sp. CFH 90114 TaxID=2493665 RepID=UPI00100E258E|nr:SiaB family protein kinase [Ammoniphilus sp. CFH 90114]RXT06458.1 hypothetical protein EIZ39_15425 [Ammoniphilus sp. CFH 90114]